jgi:uncharacterized protein YgiM (DUF1202 family)
MLAGAALALACASAPDPAPAPAEHERDVSVYKLAEQERVEYLEREVARLRADLRQAEDAMIAIESGLRSAHSRADAVSALADARVAVERGGRAAAWRADRIEEARAKLAEAERQLDAEHAGSAVFFASRARRIGETLSEEADAVERMPNAHFVKAASVNLRAGPSTAHPVLEVLSEATPVFAERSQAHWVLVRTLSGRVGWVHAQLLRAH